MGFNTIRIYFHWGYHSPDEGVYNFEGNRDVEFLLELCEELELFVLAAPGPYICAETQAGGYPSWLIAKRELNIRHNFMMLWRIFDPKFANYEIQWINQIMPIIARHQITENNPGKRGCVIGVQIDNELFETMATILPIGLHDQMRVLAKATRDSGITVPLFTNDGFEEGGWVPRPDEKKKFWSKKKFGIDLYGFDKYVIFAPSSSPKSWLVDSGVSVGSWEEWNPKNVENSMDNLEKTVRGFGGGAKDSPMFIPELQGGWFNHYQLQHTYDQIFDFYGDEYTKIILESSLAQGVTMASTYIIYGGTNWGTIGDPDVYTSYDYSGCIREFGMLSSRGRNVRKTMLLTRSFDPYFTMTERVARPNVKPSISHVLNLQREAVGGDQNVTFTFLRNFDRKKRETFDITVEEKEGSLTMSCFIPYKTSFIAIGNYTAANGVHLIFSAIPILNRLVSPNGKDEVWIVEPNIVGSMAFANKEMQLSGNMQDNALRSDGPSVILSFEADHGWSKLETTEGSLYIIGLSRQDASTAFAHFEEPYWNQGVKRSPSFVAWGADNFYFDKKTRQLEINHRRTEKELHLVSFDQLSGFTKSNVYDIPIVHTFEYKSHKNEPVHVKIDYTHWEKRAVRFNELLWENVKHLGQNGKAVYNTIDYHYTSGHALYRTRFKTPDSEHPKASLSLNVRNRATVILNGHIIGGHTTYSRQLFMPGAKIGPDPYFIGSKTYELGPYLSRSANLENELIVLVESFGLNRQAFIMNDVRNPRGIISAKLNGLSETPEWEITGVDVRKLSNPYNSTGFPDEIVSSDWESFKDVQLVKERCRIPLKVTQGVQWFRFRFDNIHKSSSLYNIPLRLHMDGSWTAMVFLNDMLIARYYGNGDGPQHDFYLPDELIHAKNNQVKILAYTWEDTEAELYIAGWPVLADSGNVITHYTEDSIPSEYMTFKESISL
ncbi:glycoside hydrolase superfamily [Choanephora cucurbitarum]|nr:glycoside hydrolase superfamily [Choanephora cucurbitarum]